MKKMIVVALLIGLLLFSQVGTALEFTVPHLFDPVFMPEPGGPFDDAEAQAGDEAVLQDVMGFLETQGIQGYETLASAGDGNLLGMALRKEKRTLLVMVRANQASGFEIAFQSDALLRGGKPFPSCTFPRARKALSVFRWRMPSPSPALKRKPW